uniref:NHR domain-containing protein n=1 Tax=Lepeophtheirus salmonis TaxID=72036 RepID=A0A0K2UFM8_LEPSM
MNSEEGTLSQGFHKEIKGRFISITDDGQTAYRSNPTEEFDQGLVFSAKPLVENSLFEIVFLSKVPSWSGSLEIGVTTVKPSSLDSVPPSSKELPSQTWTLMENSLIQNGHILKENYGSNLDKLDEGDTLGVLKSLSGEIIFFAKGVSLGPVPSVKITQDLFAFVNIYGKCASVSLTSENCQDQRMLFNDLANEATASSSNPLNSLLTNRLVYNTTNSRILANEKHSSNHRISVNNDKIRFHERKGSLIKLSNNNRTCERRRPLEEFNNGVVMTHRPLRDDELFEIRIDRLVDKWSGSIEVGMTAHNPNTLDFPSTMTNQRSGTLMMSGCGILTNGKGTKKGYGHFNLDELKEGDRIGMMRKIGGNLHFYINGQDQGVAAGRVPSPIWGVIDLYGLTVKVTIVDRDERDDKNLITKRGLSLGVENFTEDNNNRLSFHKNCGSHAAVINGGSSAHRPNSTEEFNFGVVLTNRPLLVNEIFEVRLDKMVTKWAGSIEIGVTTHSPSELDFPSTMTNIRSGTWMMTGNGVMHNGTTIIDDYGHNLDKLKVGDRVAVVRKENGTLHFFVNSEDQGPAALNVPEHVYGVIDLYGQAAQVSILDVSDHRSPCDGFTVDQYMKNLGISNETGISNSINLENGNQLSSIHIEQDQNLRFHHLHGRNARISNNGLTASRPNALGEFNDAIVVSNRPLKTGEHFEIVIERVVERWSGSIEVGVTLIRPEDLDFPNTMTDINYDSWMLSGSAIMQDGQTVRNGYCCDLDSLSVGSRLGMMRALDGSLRYTINGEDQGIACESVPPNVYAVIDLYGQCAQVSLLHNASSSLAQLQPQTSQPKENSTTSSIQMELSHISLPLVISDDVLSKHKFDPCRIGKSLKLKNNDTSLIRIKGTCENVFATGFQCLEGDEIFEIGIEEVDLFWAGSLKLGVTSDIEGLISSVKDLSLLKGDTIYLDGSQIIRNGKIIKTNYCPSIDRLLLKDKIAMRRTSDGLLKFVINSEESHTFVAASNLPSKVWPVLELSGSTMSVRILSGLSNPNGKIASSPPFGSHPLLPYASNVLQDSLEIATLDVEKVPSAPLSFHHDNHGRNIQLSHGDIATRTDSYNQGIVVSNRILTLDDIFGVYLKRVNASRWSSSIMIGVLSSSPDKIHFPVSALGLKKNAWIISGDGVFQDGVKVAKITNNLDDLKVHNSVGISISSDYSLHLWINGIDQGPVVKRLPTYNFYYGLLDLYGKCEEVSLLGSKVKESSEDDEATNHEIAKDNPSSESHTTEKNIAFSEYCTKYCEYLSMCKRFKTSLGLPKYFFPSNDSDEEGGSLHPTCFCQTCCKIHVYDLYLKKGNPPREYGVPTGWVRFPVKRGVRKESEELLSTRDWHVGYHPTKAAHIRKILDRGNLIPYDDLGLEQRKKTPKSKEDDGGSSQFLFSPTLQYIIHICSSTIYVDKKTKRSYEAKMALQLDVHPGSYKVGPPTAGTSISYDSHFKVDETEWLTKERGNTAITGILISLES